MRISVWFIDPISTFVEAMAPVASALATSRHVFRPPLQQGSPIPGEFKDAYWQLRHAVAAFGGQPPQPATIKMAAFASLPSLIQKVRHRRIADIVGICRWISNGFQIAMSERPIFPNHNFRGHEWGHILGTSDNDDRDTGGDTFANVPQHLQQWYDD